MKKKKLKGYTHKRLKVSRGAQTLELGAAALTLEEVHEVAILKRKVVLSSRGRSRVKKANQYLIDQLSKGKTLYGVNTGFGLMSNVKIEDSQIEQLQYNLLRSHAVGVGHAMPDSVVRAMLLLRANALVQGHSGVRIELIEQLLAVLNAGICPIVPQQGSVGASGDLAPLSHLALPLIGEGRARFMGEEMTGGEALAKAGLKPIRLAAKEGLALINGTQFMTAIGVLCLLDAEHLCDVADAAGAMSLEAMRGTLAAFDPLIQSVRPHPGQALSAQNVVHFMKDGGISEISLSHKNCGKVQDAYSLRCIPQVHGASRDTLTFVRQVLEREVNAVTDNPLIFPNEGKILSGGNFHGQIVAIAMDALAIAAAELASISEQRMEKLVNPVLSGLPAFLIAQGGLNSGFMIVQVAAASIVSENKTLCHPASVDSIPTSADKEDHVSMGAWAARKAGRVITNVRRVLAMELIAAAQGIDLLRPLKSTKRIEKIHARLREQVAFIEQDRSLHEDMKYVEQLIASGELKAYMPKKVED